MNNGAPITVGMHGLSRDEHGILHSTWGEIYGYVRVSTKDQKEDRQMDAMQAYGVQESHIFVEHISGKNFNRPQYKKLIQIIRKGDVVVIKSIDRLGRNYQDIIDQWRLITQDIGCGIHVIDMPTLNTSGDPTDLLSRFVTDMMLQVLSFVAENERENTLKRQKEGIEAARKRGTFKTGRPRSRIPSNFWEIYVAWRTREMPVKELVQLCKDKYGFGERTFYRRIRELNTRYGDIRPSRLRDFIIDDRGFDYATEIEEARRGYYNPYSVNPAHKEAYRRRQAKSDEEVRNEDLELRRIVMEKRFEEVVEHFDDKSDSTLPKNPTTKTIIID